MEVFRILKDYFEFVFLQYGFKLLDGEFYGKSSGFCIITDGKVDFKFVTERRNLFIEMRINSEPEWYDLSYLNRYINGNEIQKMRLEDQIDLIKKFLQSLKNDKVGTFLRDSFLSLERIKSDYRS